MEHIFFAFWWLIFPISGFLFGGFGMWLNYRRHRDHMDLLKSYADKGKEPPPEVLKAAAGADPVNDPYGYGYGYYGRRAWRRGPYWEWRRVFLFGALAAGFGYAGFVDHSFGYGSAHGFQIVAVVMGVMFAGSLMFAILASTWRTDSK
jgi:hypothetical protein